MKYVHTVGAVIVATIAVLFAVIVTVVTDSLILRQCLLGIDLQPADCWPLLFDRDLTWPSNGTELRLQFYTQRWFDELLAERGGYVAESQ